MFQESKSSYEIRKNPRITKTCMSQDLSNSAEIAIKQLKKNSTLSESINLIKNQIKTIKQIYLSIANNKSKNKINSIYQIISSYKENLLKLNKNLREDVKKYSIKENYNSKKLKGENYKNIYKLDLLSIDYFILLNKNSELQSKILSLQLNLKSSKKHNVYREPRRYIFSENYDAEDVIYSDNLKEQQKIIKIGRQFNKFHNNILVSQKKIKKYKNQINTYNNIIYVILKKSNEIFNTYYKTEQFKKNNNNKNEDINEIINSINKTLNNSKKRKKIHQKIDLLKIDELFDISNIEGKNEEIIDEELHSDEEIVFENKVHQIKQINKNYFSPIKLKIPKIDLSQIEVNKAKIMNEDDFYSAQRRKFKQKNINISIAEAKKAIKKLKRSCNLNKKKLEAIQNFIEDVKYNYKILKTLKIKTSVSGNKIDDNYKNKFFDIIGEAIDEEVGSDYSDEDKYEQDSNEEEKKHRTCKTESNFKTDSTLTSSENKFFKNQLKKKVDRSKILKKIKNSRPNSK